jgi:hypothetical protein
VEHVKGYSPEPPFNGYGDVVAVKAQVDDITIDGKVEKRKALYAQVNGNAQLQKLAKADQKPFPSVELTPGYAGIDKVGLVGLAFTDSPASIATQKLQFSRSAPGTFHAHGSDAIALEFDADASDPAKVEGAIAGFFTALTAKFSKADPATPPAPKEEPKQAANDNDLSAFATAMGDTVAKSIAAAMAPVTAAQTALQADFAILKGKLEQTEQPGFSRTPASGGGAAFATDC